jgi:hypothetical protein
MMLPLDVRLVFVSRVKVLTLGQRVEVIASGVVRGSGGLDRVDHDPELLSTHSLVVGDSAAMGEVGKERNGVEGKEVSRG